MSNLDTKRVVLIVTGGIAAYKAIELVRRLREQEAEVRVVMTPAAQQFVGPLSFQAVSGQAVHVDLLDERAEAAMGHIELARWAELVVVAPASADFIARVRAGLADDLAATTILATSAPITLVPAMNQQMWANTATQDNIAALRERDFTILGPASGAQACGEVGAGRMLEAVEIVAALGAGQPPQGTLAGTTIMITAGPTQEAIDPVRYISNRSSGKMGYAVAAAAVAAGAEVILVTGPTALPTPSGVKRVDIISANDMFEAVMADIEQTDIFIAAAAVADYNVAEPATQKRKKEGTSLRLTLSPTQDILKCVTAREKPPFAVGFAAETENLRDNALAKLNKKSLDMIAANTVGVAGVGFESNDNELQVMWHDGGKCLKKASKRIIAEQLVELIAARYSGEI